MSKKWIWKSWTFSSVAILASVTVAAGQDLARKMPLPQPPAEAAPPTAFRAPSTGSAPTAFAPLAVGPNWTAIGPAPIPNGQTQGACSGGATPGHSCGNITDCGVGGTSDRGDPASGR